MLSQKNVTGENRIENTHAEQNGADQRSKLRDSMTSLSHGIQSVPVQGSRIMTELSSFLSDIPLEATCLRSNRVLVSGRVTALSAHGATIELHARRLSQIVSDPSICSVSLLANECTELRLQARILRFSAVGHPSEHRYQAQLQWIEGIETSLPILLEFLGESKLNLSR